MTKLQREERNILLTEAKNRNEAETGDFRHVVVGPPGRESIKKFPKK